VDPGDVTSNDRQKFLKNGFFAVISELEDLCSEDYADRPDMITAYWSLVMKANFSVDLRDIAPCPKGWAGGSPSAWSQKKTTLQKASFKGNDMLAGSWVGEIKGRDAKSKKRPAPASDSESPVSPQQKPAPNPRRATGYRGSGRDHNSRREGNGDRGAPRK
jgi:hypothetical protein